MRKGFSALMSAAALLSLPTSLPAETTMDQKPIDEANAKLISLQKDGNAAGMAEMYTEDAILLPAGGPRTDGRAAIGEFWEGKLGPGLEDVELVTEELVRLANDLAYEIGRYEATPPEGAPVSGQYLVLWKRVDDEWKLHVDIFNEHGKGQ